MYPTANIDNIEKDILFKLYFNYIIILKLLRLNQLPLAKLFHIF